MRPIKMMKIKEISDLSDLPQGPSWIIQDKHDGYFVQILKEQGDTQIISRRGQHYEDKLPTIVDALDYLPDETILLGELVYSENGIEDVGDLTSIVGSDTDKALSRQEELEGYLKVVFFDLLWYNGIKYTDSPYIERLTKLRSIIPDSKSLELILSSSNLEGFYQSALSKGMEGVVLKNSEGSYPIKYSGEEPSSQNLQYKLKRMPTLDVVAYDYELGTGKNANTLGALLIGLYDGTTLVNIGKVGTGFSDDERDGYLKQIKRGDFVIEVRFKNITDDFKLRHPSFLRDRLDKVPKFCKIEDLERLRGVKSSRFLQSVPNPLRRNFDFM